MSIAPGLLALALVGAGGATKREVALIDYNVRFLEMDGPGWRQSVHSRLQPVARQGTSSVWTAGRDVIRPLSERALNHVRSPKIRAESGSVAHVTSGTTRRIATEFTRHADGPFDHATSVAYTPEYEDVREGFRATVAGRKLDQGVLARLVFEDSRIAAVHQVTLSEAVATKDPAVASSKAAPRIEVPEIVKGSVEGEWLIPNDGVLVLSLGTYTVADREGRAVVRERLALLEAKAISSDPERLGTRRPHPTAITVPAGSAQVTTLSSRSPNALPAPPMPMPTPLTPSRTLPEATDADGTPVALPPLPEGPPVPSTMPGSSEPVASPQARPRPEAGSRDEEASRTSLKLEVGVKRSSELHWASWSPVKPLSFRIPLGGEAVIEIEAKLLPAPSR